MEKSKDNALDEINFKPISKRNYLVYFYGYFAPAIINSIAHIYLPIYFYDLLNVNKAEFAFIQIFSYSVLFVKLLVSIYFDRSMARARLLIILSSIGMFICLIFLLTTVQIIEIFGIFLGINFACVSILDVAIDKFIVIRSPTKKLKERNALCTNLGALLGAIFPNAMSILILSDIYSFELWNQFFLVGIITVLPLIIITFLLKVEGDVIPKKASLAQDKSIPLKSVILMCVFVFLAYADRLYEYPLEPWAIIKLGPENMWLFSLFMVIFVAINAVGLVIAGSISHMFDRKLLLISSTIIDGVLIIIAPFTNIIVFFILIMIVNFFAGFFIINMISLMIELSKSSVLIFQIMAAFTIVASVILIPLGTFLSSFVPTEIIIAIAGALITLAIVPAFLIKDESKE